jgi:hypothetical protein
VLVTINPTQSNYKITAIYDNTGTSLPSPGFTPVIRLSMPFYPNSTLRIKPTISTGSEYSNFYKFNDQQYNFSSTNKDVYL